MFFPARTFKHERRGREHKPARPAPLSTRRMVSLPASLFYADTVRTLREADVPFVVGGAFALKHYADVARGTKDLDLFLPRAEVPRALEALGANGYVTDETFPHWLSKAWCGEHFVDLIHGSANGLCAVDQGWIDHAEHVTIFGQAVRLCPIEEMIWSKSFVMERERFDGADVCHLLAARGDTIDWRRLLDRVGPSWRVLLGHLVLFGFVYPRERSKIPPWVVATLARRLEHEDAEDVPVCNGTLLSREQYLFDVSERGYADARLPPFGDVAEAELAVWTRAIGSKK